MLLGGLNDQYKTMYEQSIEVVKERMLFRPMTENGRDVLLSGGLSTTGNLNTEGDVRLKYEGTHLTCFAGGMFAVGAKIFERTEELAIAAKLTDGCVWAYESTTTGIMPEIFTAVPCEQQESCAWNETKWWEALDPYQNLRADRAHRQALKAQADDTGDAAKTAEPKDAVASKASPKDTVKEKRQLGNIDADKTLGTKVVDNAQLHDKLPLLGADSPEAAYTPPPAPSHEEFVKTRIREERLPPGFADIGSKKYILRPEAIESVFIMYRVTGDDYWREKGWNMFKAIQNYTFTELGNTAIKDVTSSAPVALDEMESFWLAETLKYFYLLFSDPNLVSLDDYVLNTEAHPFKRPK